EVGNVRQPSDGNPLQLVEFEDQCREIMQKYDLEMIILTCGVNGSYVLYEEGKVSYQATPKVKVADTVGAGDSFTGTFVANLLKGKPVAEAHGRAVAVSAFVCTQDGAMPAVPGELLD
ncbi:MAG: carbohydrate kinase family protein, partial [Candidatus Cryptobacteroides sp.]